MANINKKFQSSLKEFLFNLQKCEFCKGKDGKEKEVYENFQLALGIAEYIRKERGIFLKVYECPHGNGWHLTKDNTPLETNQDNDIPLKSSDGSWEYIRDENHENNDFDYDNSIEINSELKQNIIPIPINKKDCNPEINSLELSGKVMEIINNINIEKIFGITSQNDFFNSIINQITIYVENNENNQLDSYTILVKKKMIKKKNINKGDQIKVNITVININNIKRWYCNKIL
jgi:hypothetical protein